MSVNNVAFTPEEVEKGMVIDFIQFLLEQNKKLERSFNDIHITSDSYCTIVEWIQKRYDDSDESFEYVDGDHLVVKEIYFPDGHYEWVKTKEEEKERWEEFLKEDPGWYQDSYGTWRHKDDEVK